MRQVLRSNIIGLPCQHAGYLDWKCKDVAIAIGSLILQQLTLIDTMWMKLHYYSICVKIETTQKNTCTKLL